MNGCTWLVCTQGMHADVRVLAMSHASGCLVVAGLGGRSKSCEGVTISVWSCEGGVPKIRHAAGSSKVQADSVWLPHTALRIQDMHPTWADRAEP